MTQPNSSGQPAFVAYQPLDKWPLHHCQLYCFPNYLQLISPFVNVFQAVDFSEELSIKIYHIDYDDFLYFLHECTVILQNVEMKKPTKDLEHKTTINLVDLKFIYEVATNTALLTISKAEASFTFDTKLFPIFLTAVARLIFKSFSYSHNINYLVLNYVQSAPMNLVKNPTYNSCYSIFEKMEPAYIDFFLLFDIVSRHKKLLVYVKRFYAFNDE